MMIPVALFVASAIVPYYRRVVRMTAFEFLEKRFGYGARAFASLNFLVIAFYSVGIILFLLAKAVHAITDFPIEWIIVITGAVAVCYTVLGGLEAVIWTDVLQSITLFGGGLVCLGILLLGADGGGNLVQVAFDAGKFKMVDWSLDLTGPTVVVMMFFGVFALADNRVCGQASVQRYLSVPMTRDAQKSVWFGAISNLITWTMFISIGTLLYSYYHLHPELISAETAARETEVFPHFMKTGLPAGIAGLLLAGMCAAAMSSLDTVINSGAMITVYDLYERFRPRVSDRARLLLGRAASLTYGLLGMAIALWIYQSGVEEALKFNMKVFSIIGGGILGVFLLGIFVRRAHAVGFYAGLAVGVLISGWGILDIVLTRFNVSDEFIEAVKFPLHPLMIITCANLASFAVGWVVSLLVPDAGKRG